MTIKIKHYTESGEKEVKVTARQKAHYAMWDAIMSLRDGLGNHLDGLSQQELEEVMDYVYQTADGLEKTFAHKLEE